MNAPPLVDAGRIQIRLDPFGVAPATALSETAIMPKVQEYRRRMGTRMFPLDVVDIRKRLPSADYFVSRKLDGQFGTLIFRNDQVALVTPLGDVLIGLPWMDEAAQLLQQAGVQQALIAGEHYVQLPERRSRIHDVLQATTQPANSDKLSQLRFAAFDIVEWNDELPPLEYAEIWSRLENALANGQTVHPVDTRSAVNATEVQHCFRDLVESEGSEGIVVRSDEAGLFKIKPRLTIDAVVLGFTEGTEDRQDMVQDLLLGLARPDGALQVLCRLGYGLTDEERRSWLPELSALTVESEYAEVNADHVAFRMVRPEWIVEFSCLDLVSQTTRGGPVNRMVLQFNSTSQAYQIVRRMPLVSVVGAQLERKRPDKSVDPFDIRIDQVAKVVHVPMADRDAQELTLPPSQLLRRAVYIKQLRGATMVRKFLLWKTNKEELEGEEFPGYVLYFTDFSPNRKLPLQRDIRISNSREQMEQLWEMFVADKIKQGWRIHSTWSPEAP